MTEQELKNKALALATIIMGHKENKDGGLTIGNIQALIMTWFEEDVIERPIDRLNDAIEEK